MHPYPKKGGDGIHQIPQTGNCTVICKDYFGEKGYFNVLWCETRQALFVRELHAGIYPPFFSLLLCLSQILKTEVFNPACLAERTSVVEYAENCGTVLGVELTVKQSNHNDIITVNTMFSECLFLLL